MAKNETHTIRISKEAYAYLKKLKYSLFLTHNHNTTFSELTEIALTSLTSENFFEYLIHFKRRKIIDEIEQE